jgi:hypothetical protein
VVGVKVGDQHLVELVDRELQAREVGQRAAAEVAMTKKVALGIAHLDEDAPRRLGTGDPGVAAAENGDPQLAVFELLGPRHEPVGVLARERSDDRGGRDRPLSAREGRERQAARVAGRRIGAAHVRLQGSRWPRLHRLGLWWIGPPGVAG